MPKDTNSNDLTNNPLVNPPQQPFNAPPLGLFEPKHVEPAADWALTKSRANIAAIADNDDVPTFENTIHALAFADEELGDVLTPFFEMKGALNSAEVQQVMQVIQPKLSDYSTEVSLNSDLFDRIKDVYDNTDHSTLSAEEKTLLEKTYNSFRFNGALLKGQDRETYKKLSLKISELTTKFSNNVVNSAAELNVVIEAKDKSRLDGIPEDIIASYQENAKDALAAATEIYDSKLGELLDEYETLSDTEKLDAAKLNVVLNDITKLRDDHKNKVKELDGSYMITMTPPPLDVYEYAKDHSLRDEVKKVSDKKASEGEYDNTQVALDILETRHAIAKLLGFKNHAEKTIRSDTRMAETTQTAMDFVENNAAIYAPISKKFYKELEEFAKNLDGVTKLKSCDLFYYRRLMKEDQIGYDAEATRKYLTFDNCLQGAFASAKILYNVDIKEVDGKYSKMHDDIRTFEILDAKTGDVRALYFLDPCARPQKNGGAWMSDIRNAGLHHGKQEIPIVGNYCNFTKPADGKPFLLSANENTTLRHELGHGLHGALGKGTYPDLTGINVHWDYVELPSQLNECWASKPEVLATYAKHHDTGAVMPKDMMDKLQKLDEFDAKWIGVRQSELALLDLSLYTTDPKDIANMGLQAFQDKIWKDTEVMEWDAPPFALNFSHIFAGGYSAGYYSYKWADALVADVFEQFEKQGIHNPTLCEAFKKHMIEPGGTRAPSEMHKDFNEAIGEGRRGLDAGAMFRREGITPVKKQDTKPSNPASPKR